MRRSSLIFFSLVLIGPFCAMAEGLSFYVSPLGNDAWSGQKVAPDAAGTDGPFATLERARDEVRRLKAQGAIPAEGIQVILRAGTYYLKQTFELGSEDSGTEAAPVAYTAFAGEEVRLSGARPLANFTALTDESVLARLDESARGHVIQTDLRGAGIEDYGPPDSGGAEIFFNDSAMGLARWPNEGFVKIADLVVEDGHKIHGVPGSMTPQFKYEGDRPSRWVDEPAPWLHGYWFWDWSDQRQAIEKIDTANAIITLKPPAHGYGYRKGQWYYAFNMLSELDAPGEWYIDRDKGILYFWPPRDIKDNQAAISMLGTIVSMKEASNVRLSGLTMEMSRGTAVTVAGGSGVLVTKCVIRNTGSSGASLSGQGHGVTDCDIYGTGGGGLSLSGGDRVSLTSGAMYAENNHIHHYGRINRMYTPGIALGGVGATVRHNLIHTAPHMAIQFGGNDHLIELNEIHHVCLESNDAGAIYAGRDWTMRGHVIRYNYLHQITGFEDKGCMGVYLDDMFASATVYGNVFWEVARAILLGGGRDNSIENNIFIDCKPALQIDARAMNWAHYHADEWIKEAQEKGTLSGMLYNQPPYSTRYPQLVTILQGEPKAPEGNVIARNICWGGQWEHTEPIAKPYLKFEDNVVNTDPLFVDAANQDFNLRADSPAWAVGFRPIPFNEIGLKRAQGAEDQARLLIDLGASALESKDYAKARDTFEGIVRMDGLPAWYRSLAQLRVIDCLALEQRYDDAERACLTLDAMEGVPPHHKWEAGQLLAGLRRVKAGQPPNGPEAGRTKVEPAPAPAAIYHIGPNGNDSADGSETAPFATFERAIEAVRALKAASGGQMPAGGACITFLPGVYHVRQTLKVAGDLAGREGAPLVIKGRSARINGGALLEGLAVVEDAAVLARLPEESRGKVLWVDLKAQGVEALSPMAERGFAKTATPCTELYVGGKRMTLARWPNEGFVKIGKVIDPGAPGEGRGATFEYADDRPARWTQAKDIWLYGYWFYDWADNAIGAGKLDPALKQITTQHMPNYGVKEGQRYHYYNLLEEIDQPGEWYVDREAMRLYMYPPEGAAGPVELTTLAEPLLSVQEADYVRIESLTFELGSANGIEIKGGENCLVSGCVLRRLGGTGVILHGRNSGVLSCDIYQTARGGTEILGGNRKTLEPGGLFVENCHIHDFSLVDHTYTPAVHLDGVGNRISHNKFHGSTSSGIRMEGNDHLVEFNEVYDVVRESDDQGGLDTFGNAGYRGSVLRYNHWHDIGNDESCGMAGIRLDDAISGTVIYGNVFERCSRGLFGAVQVHGGKDNWIDNNIMADCQFGISFSQWGKKRWEEFLAGYSKKLLHEDVEIDQPPYSTKYPDLARMHEGIDINNVWRNVIYNCGAFMTRDNGLENTLNNLVVRFDPLMAGERGWMFALPDGNYAWRKIGFRSIPFEDIGLYDDVWRSGLTVTSAGEDLPERVSSLGDGAGMACIIK